MKTMTKVMMMVVFVFSILFQNGIVAKADTTPIKSGKDLYQLNVMAKKMDPVCKKYNLVARNSYVGDERATCVDKNDKKMLADVTQLFVGSINADTVPLAVDVVILLGTKDSKTNLLNAISQGKKKLGYGIIAKGGTGVTVNKDGSVHFINYGFKTEISPNTNSKIDLKIGNTMAKTIQPLCQKYGLKAKGLSGTATCVDKKDMNFNLLIISDGMITSSPTKIHNTLALTVDIAYLLGKKDTKAELLRVSKLAVATPHKYFKTKNGTPIVADKGGRVNIPYTKTAITKINKSLIKGSNY